MFGSCGVFQCLLCLQLTLLGFQGLFLQCSMHVLPVVRRLEMRASSTDSSLLIRLRMSEHESDLSAEWLIIFCK